MSCLAARLRTRIDPRGHVRLSSPGLVNDPAELTQLRWRLVEIGAGLIKPGRVLIKWGADLIKRDAGLLKRPAELTKCRAELIKQRAELIKSGVRLIKRGARVCSDLGLARVHLRFPIRCLDIIEPRCAGGFGGMAFGGVRVRWMDGAAGGVRGLRRVVRAALRGGSGSWLFADVNGVRVDRHLMRVGAGGRAGIPLLRRRALRGDSLAGTLGLAG